MRTGLLGVASVAVGCLAWSALGAQPMEEVIVEASPIVKTVTTGGGSPAPGYFKVAMSGRVSYADLDLKKPADVATLEKRIKEAATEVCTALGKAYPESGPETKACAKQAVERAMPSMQKAIAAAAH